MTDLTNHAPERRPTATSALELFIGTIEATGGVIETMDGDIVPATDGDWCDLGDAYVAACAALGREPKLTKEEGSGNDRLADH